MSTTSITHRPAPVAAAAAAAVAVLALSAVLVSHDDTSTQAPGSHTSHQVDPFKHFEHFPPLKGGTTMVGP